MSKTSKLTCPDCGGVLGIPEDGEMRCTCFLPEPDLRTSNSDTQRIELGGTPKTKVCIVCGKDVSGHRRFKDSRGYMCYPCGKAEEESKLEGTIPCPQCGRRLRPGGFFTHEGKRICRTCYDNRRKGVAVKIVDTKLFEQHEKRTVLFGAIVFGILLVIVLYALLTRGFTFLR